MVTKNEVKNPLSDYEMDAMWMSYRYAIGRSSIACVMHAGNMVKNVYGRIPENRVDFTVYDMRREINQRLSWEYNFGLDYSIWQEEFDSIKALMEFSKRQDVHEIGLLKFLQNHSVKVSKGINGEYMFYIEETKDNHFELYAHQLDDLVVWANAANALDSKKHHTITTEYEGQIKKYEAFELMILHYNHDTQQFNLELHYCPIESYLETAGKQSYLAEEFIKKIDKKQNNYDKEKNYIGLLE